MRFCTFVSHGKETEPGTLIWQVFSTTVTNVLPTLVKTIELSIDVDKRRALFEKAAPMGAHVGRWLGLLPIAAGVWLLA